jgi:hypothetical protein
MAMLLALMGVMLSALLVPMVLTQVGSTREDVRRVHALHAAQTGLDVAVGHIRAANDGSGSGVLADLPCGQLTGTVRSPALAVPNAAGGSARYQVAIDYYAADPLSHLTDPLWITTNRIDCIPGGGPSRTPAFALLNSLGTDQATGAFGSVPVRSLQGTYTFKTNNQNISGGLIHVFKTATSTDLCMDAGSGTPLAGTNLRMQPCDSGNIQQTFAYNTNLTLVLVASKTLSKPLGMCLDAGTPQAVGKVAQFQPCAIVTAPQQQWSINDAANFEGTADGATLDGFCLNVQTPNTAGSFVILGSTGTSTCHRAYDNIETFSVEATVGAGAAGAVAAGGPPPPQLVNFNQFGRCLDVTEQKVTFLYMIAWPCKQAPDPANVTWNQKWALPAIPTGSTSATGRITTNQPTLGTYCLNSPLSTVDGQYVTVTPCPGAATTSNQSWTVYGDTGTYASSYRIVDSAGYCLTPTSAPDYYPNGNNVSKLIVATCGGLTLQKWNAPPNLLKSLALKDLNEK